MATYSSSSTHSSASKISCLLVLPGVDQGVSAQSFVQTYTILHQAQMQIQLATPGGRPYEFVNQDDTNRKWIADFRSKSYSQPIALDSVDSSRYTAVVIPHAPGAVHDLAKDRHLCDLLNHFIETGKLICAMGQGCAALCCARTENKRWAFKGYCLTAMTIYELAKQTDFPEMNVIVEEFMRDNGAIFSGGQPDALHVAIDRNVITAQNEQSTLTAVQNVVLLCNLSRPRTALSR